MISNSISIKVNVDFIKSEPKDNGEDIILRTYVKISYLCCSSLTYSTSVSTIYV